MPVETPTSEEWARATTAEVLARTRDFIDASAVGREQRGLLTRALEEHRAFRARDAELVPAVHLPLLVHEAIAGRSPPVDLAVACGFLELGADLLDHVAEDELGPHWEGVPRSLVGLVATGFVGALPQLLLADLPAEAERKIALQRTMARQLFRIGAGQQTDLELAAGARPALARAEASVLGKTGERRALYARLAAELAGAEERVAEAYEAVARELSIARQITSDCLDLVGGAPSRDLAAGARTWPLVWVLSRLDVAAADRFGESLDACRTDSGQHAAVRTRVLETGALRAATLRTQVSCQKALRALDAAGPSNPAGSRLRAMIEDAGLAAQVG